MIYLNIHDCLIQNTTYDDTLYMINIGERKVGLAKHGNTWHHSKSKGGNHSLRVVYSV